MNKIFIGLISGLLVYELIALSNHRDGDTISEIVWWGTTKRPILPFSAGILMGHFFWQKDGS